MTANPKEVVIKDSGACVGWACLSCNNMHSTARFGGTNEEANASARASAERCCVPNVCACGAKPSSSYGTQCTACWRAEHEAKDEARWNAAPTMTIAQYLEGDPDGYVTDGDDGFWSLETYIDDEVFLRHPRVWFCDPIRGIKLDADDVLENWGDDRHEDAIEDLDVPALQAALDAWCAKQVTCSWTGTGTRLDPAEVERLCREAAARDAAEVAS